MLPIARHFKKLIKARAANGGLLDQVNITLTGTRSTQWARGINLKGHRHAEMPTDAKAVKISDANARVIIDAERERSVALSERLLMDAPAAIARPARQAVPMELGEEKETAPPVPTRVREDPSSGQDEPPVKRSRYGRRDFHEL